MKKIISFGFFAIVVSAIGFYVSNLNFNSNEKNHITKQTPTNRFEHKTSLLIVPEHQALVDEENLLIDPIQKEKSSIEKPSSNENMNSDFSYPQNRDVVSTNNPATKDNIDVQVQDEYFDQIDQATLNDAGKVSGYLQYDTNSLKLDEVNAEVIGENASEINQQSIIDNARLNGYVLTDAAQSTEPALTEKNLSSPATGQYADQINN